jgi:hypothetical protein
MRRNAKSITTSPQIVRNIQALTEANFTLLTKLIHWLDGHEKQHTRFRMAMIQKMARLETAVSLVLVGQEAQTQSSPPWYEPDKLQEAVLRAEEFITKQSEVVAMKMVRCIYGEEDAPEPRRDRRRKWSGWEI